MSRSDTETARSASGRFYIENDGYNHHFVREQGKPSYIDVFPTHGDAYVLLLRLESACTPCHPCPHCTPPNTPTNTTTYLPPTR